MLPIVYNQNQGLNGFGAWVKRNKAKVMKAGLALAGVSTVLPFFGPLAVLVGTAASAMYAYDEIAGMVASEKEDNAISMTGALRSRTAPSSNPYDVIIGNIGWEPIEAVTSTPTLPGSFDPYPAAPQTPAAPADSDEPSPADQALLLPWVENKLQPFYNQVMIDLATALGYTETEQQVDAINDVLLQMSVIQGWYSHAGISGLSAEGKEAMKQLMVELFDPVRKVIADTMAQYPNDIKAETYVYTYTSPEDAVLFEKTINVGSIIGRNYATSRYLIIDNNQSSSVTDDGQDLEAETPYNPGKATETDPEETETDPETDPETETDNPAGTGQDAQPETKNNDAVKILGFIGLGIVAIKFLSKKK